MAQSGSDSCREGFRGTIGCTDEHHECVAAAQSLYSIYKGLESTKLVPLLDGLRNLGKAFTV